MCDFVNFLCVLLIFCASYVRKITENVFSSDFSRRSSPHVSAVVDGIFFNRITFPNSFTFQNLIFSMAKLPLLSFQQFVFFRRKKYKWIFVYNVMALTFNVNSINYLFVCVCVRASDWKEPHNNNNQKKNQMQNFCNAPNRFFLL